MADYKILLVDDDENVINSLKRVLHEDNYNIIGTISAELAEEIVLKEKPDLIICDYKMFGMNGMDFLNKISEKYPEIINILLTGNADLNMAIDAINKSILYKFILKPWDNDDLRVTVKLALAHKKVLAENRKLLNEIKKRDEYIEKFERQYPGITSVKRDDKGNIILE
ncbi:MAG: response regulator [Candidatus Omnitrophica bacterium]|jgi:DNA-binding NtrC family response regulator|nr:response regulator [Candidatus Omnitrophota bacterium]MDD5081552.1 response regulator [Candidatus Omnitrophota bacterium]MDD5440647.1 response regulator [Candidatus Omnitrophota bacterium]